jgi:membrane protein YdbS with pleckstrin-like domain
VARYLRSLGLWELERRATSYTVTNRRFVVEEGLIHRVIRGVPLGSLQRVTIRTGPWEGYLDVSASGMRGPVAGEIGPLRSTVARRLAAALAEESGSDLVEE